MKCQKCERQAIYHITELAKGKPTELHLCEEHAREYLAHGEAPAEEAAEESALPGNLVQQMAIGQAAKELAELDKQTCPVCGISFYEFRNKGRLGCPHDYIVFEKQLHSLLASIHGDVQHVGKVPARSAAESEQRLRLMRLRREMKDAVTAENYERAKELRDEIRTIELQLKPSLPSSSPPSLPLPSPASDG